MAPATVTPHSPALHSLHNYRLISIAQLDSVIMTTVQVMSADAAVSGAFTDLLMSADKQLRYPTTGTHVTD